MTREEDNILIKLAEPSIGGQPSSGLWIPCEEVLAMECTGTKCLGQHGNAVSIFKCESTHSRTDSQHL